MDEVSIVPVSVIHEALAPTRAMAADLDALADSLVAGQLSPRTRKAYASDLAELIGALERWGLGLGDVTRDHLHLYRRWLTGETVPGLPEHPRSAPATVSRKVSVIRQLFLEAFERGLITANPASRLRGFRVSPESKSQGLTRQEARDLLAAIDTRTLLGLRDRAMLSLMLRTGIRRMDVLSATIGALSQHQGHRVLRVLGKGAKERTIKIPVDCWRDLEAWLEAAAAVRLHEPNTPLFVGLRRVRTGQRRDPQKPPIYNVIGNGQKPLAEKAVWKVVERTVRAAGIEGNITPHSTRHTFITLALDGGAPLHKVQVAAGHADPRTTERYWRTKENLDDNAVDYVKL